MQLRVDNNEDYGEDKVIELSHELREKELG